MCVFVCPKYRAYMALIITYLVHYNNHIVHCIMMYTSSMELASNEIQVVNEIPSLSKTINFEQ